MICTVDNCSNKILCKQVCKKHYMQQYRSSDTQRLKEKAYWNSWYSKNSESYYLRKKQLRTTDMYKARVNEYRRERYRSDMQFKLTCILRTFQQRAFSINNSLIKVVRK